MITEKQITQPSAFPKDVYALYDEINKKAQLVRNGQAITLWKRKQINIKNPGHSDNPQKKTQEQRVKEILGRDPMPWEKKERNLLIEKQLIIGITLDKKLIGIPLDGESLHIGYIGRTRQGKTVAMHSGIDQLQHYHQIPTYYNNDKKFENFYWSEKTIHKEWVTTLEHLGMQPTPQKIVFLSPHINDEQKSMIIYGNKEQIHLYITLNIQEVLRHWDLLLEGIKDLQLGATWNLLTENEQQLKKITTKEEYKEFMKEIMKNKEYQKGQKGKLKRVLDTLINNEVINIGTPEATSTLTIKNTAKNKEQTLPTIPALLQAGINVNLATENLSRIRIGGEKLDDGWHNIIFKQIYELKRRGTLLKGKKLVIATDEIGTMIDGGALTSIEEIASMGGGMNIMFMYGHQWFTEIEKKAPDITKNTAYIIQVNSDPKEIQAALKSQGQEHNKSSLEYQTIKNLRPLEAAIYTSNAELIITDIETGKQKRTTGGFHKINLIPPLSRHKKGTEETKEW